MSKYSTDYLLTLAHLMGERTVQDSTTASRTTFIRSTLKEIDRAYPWPWNTVRTSLTINSGVATLASNYDPQHGLEAYFYEGTQETNTDFINEIDQVGVLVGDNRYWVESLPDGNFVVKTKDLYTPIYVKYQAKTPEVGASVYSNFDDDMCVALGARRYIKLSQDPNADIAQDEANFQKRLTENIAAVQVNNPKRRMRILGNANNHRTGGGYD